MQVGDRVVRNGWQGTIVASRFGGGYHPIKYTVEWDNGSRSDHPSHDMKKSPRRYTHMAKKTSSPEWLGDFQCLSADEAIIWGPVFKADLISYGNDITHALYNHVKDVNVRLHLRRGKCVLVELQLVHAFWNRTLVFRFPPMKASEVVAHAWGAITTAMTRPNVDPVALARESLSHGFPPHENPDSESFSIFGQQ